MITTLAEEILSVAGPGNILHYGGSSDALVTALRYRGCQATRWTHDVASCDPAALGANNQVTELEPNRSFDTVVVDPDAIAKALDLTALFLNLRPATGRCLVVVTTSSSSPGRDSSIESLRDVEAKCLLAGFRYDPGNLNVSRYLERMSHRVPAVTAFEKLPASVWQRWPGAEQGPPEQRVTDLSREASVRADASLARYALAAEWIRPGDRVVELGCGSGFGVAMMAAQSRGAVFAGLDLDEGNATYAAANFSRNGVQFDRVLDNSLAMTPDHSIDFLTAFEPIDDAEGSPRLLDALARVLRPDGRLLLGVPPPSERPTPNKGSGIRAEAARRARLHQQLSSRFVLEACYSLPDPNDSWPKGDRQPIEQHPVGKHWTIDTSKWWLLVASARPSSVQTKTYSHPAFDVCCAGSGAIVTAFGRYYDNPWIYRTIIQNGERIRDPGVLSDAVAQCEAAAREDSADRGGLLCVRAYEALSKHQEQAQREVLAEIATYLRHESANPHVLRWQISLAYVAALLNLTIGSRTAARKMLERVLATDPLRFSPLIATKHVAGAFQLGIMALADDRPQDAEKAFRLGIEVARQCLHADDTNAIGNPDHPLAFGFSELAELADMAAQCATALHELPLFARNPGLFWRTVDVKRFGLMSWNKALETENRELKRALLDFSEQIAPPPIRSNFVRRLGQKLSALIASAVGASSRKVSSVIGGRRHP